MIECQIYCLKSSRMWKKVWPKELKRMSEPRDHSKYSFYLFVLELLESFGHQGKCLEMFGHGFAEALKQWYTMMHLRMASAATSSLFAENAPWRRQSLVWSWPFIVAQFPGRESGAGGLREWSWWPQLRQQCMVLLTPVKLLADASLLLEATNLSSVQKMDPHSEKVLFEVRPCHWTVQDL